MSQNGTRYVFSGHAVGVAAQFHRLGEMENLEHVIPALGAAVLPVTGGLAHARSTCYEYPVEKPWKRSLLSVRHVESRAVGKRDDDSFVTEVHSVIEDVNVLEKLHIRRVELHMKSSKKEDGVPTVSTSGNIIDGMQLGNVHVAVDLDDDLLGSCGNRDQLAKHFAGLEPEEKKRIAWRFRTDPGAAEIRTFGERCHCTLVTAIHLSGPEDELEKIPEPKRNVIYWPGFGRIYLGEVLVGERDRRLTMVRLDMGSDAGGSGTIGDAGTNGSVSM